MKKSIGLNCHYWFIALVILGLLTAGCMSTPGTSSNNKAPELTKKADVFESLSMFDGYLERSPQDWYVNESFCGGGTCRQQIIAADGDTMVVTLTRYPSGSDAENSFNALKKGLKKYQVNDEKIADSGYSWHQGNQSESGFLSGQNIGVVDYQVAKGDATGNQSINLAAILAETVAAS